MFLFYDGQLLMNGEHAEMFVLCAPDSMYLVRTTLTVSCARDRVSFIRDNASCARDRNLIHSRYIGKYCGQHGVGLAYMKLSCTTYSIDCDKTTRGEVC